MYYANVRMIWGYKVVTAVKHIDTMGSFYTDIKKVFAAKYIAVWWSVSSTLELYCLPSQLIQKFLDSKDKQILSRSKLKSISVILQSLDPN